MLKFFDNAINWFFGKAADAGEYLGDGFQRMIDAPHDLRNWTAGKLFPYEVGTVLESIYPGIKDKRCLYIIIGRDKHRYHVIHVFRSTYFSISLVNYGVVDHSVFDDYRVVSCT